MKAALQKKLNASQQHALAAKAATSTQGCLTKGEARKGRELLFPSFNTDEATRGLRCPVQDTYTVEQVQRCPPKQGGVLADDMRGEAERTRLLKRKERFYCRLPVVMGGLQGDGARLFRDEHSKRTRSNTARRSCKRGSSKKVSTKGKIH